MTRPYRSALRAEQAARTRDRLVEALAEQLGEGIEEFSIPRVAERVGVSVRTVYSHFPNREAQIDAVAQWLDARIAGDERSPSSLEEMLVLYERICQRSYVDSDQRLVRAQLVPGVAKLVRARRKRARERAVERAVIVDTDAVSGRLAAAALNTVCGADIGFAMQDRFGLEPAEVVETHMWILRVLVGAIRRGDLPTRRPPAAKIEDAQAPERVESAGPRRVRASRSRRG